MKILRHERRGNQRRNVVELRSRKDFDPTLLVPVLIPPGEYELTYRDYRLGTQFQRGSLAVWFEVDEYPETFLARFYNVTRLGQRGFRANPASDLVSEFRALFPRPLSRTDQIPLDWFQDYGPRYMGNVATVVNDYRGSLRPDDSQYSKVESLFRRL